MPTKVRVKITAKRQVAFPAAALKALGVKPGDYLELTQGKESWRLTPMGVDLSKLAPLRAKIPANHPACDLTKWRNTPKDHARLRD
jgi:AbrB family looped-hinge helix DNA binding protein